MTRVRGIIEKVRGRRVMAGLVVASVVLLAPNAAEAYAASWTLETAPADLNVTAISDGQGLDAVSCTESAGTSKCVAVGHSNDTGYGVAYKGSGTGTISWSKSHLPSSKTEGLRGVSCFDASTCWAVGNDGTILSTTNGASSWAVQQAGTSHRLNDVACTSLLMCVAVGEDGKTRVPTILRTIDGGTTWIPVGGLPSLFISQLIGVDCHAPTSTCVATGFIGGILRSVDNGVTWSPETSNTRFDIFGISCPTSDYCVAVENNGQILRYSAGAWTTVGTGDDNFESVSCSGQSCFAAGYRGLLRASSDGGLTWVAQTPTTPVTTIRGVSCTPSQCRAVGTKGTEGTASYTGGAIQKI